MPKYIQLIKAASILGLKPTGVEKAPDALLESGLRNLITPDNPLIELSDLNHLYSTERDKSGVINAKALHEFSVILKKCVSSVLDKSDFPVVLGGDCSILLGLTAALKELDRYGLLSFDAHADYYHPTQSISGEAADMDIALITGYGPDILANIDGLKPYMQERDIVHIGQRDEQETVLYGSSQIQETNIHCFPLKSLEQSFVQTKEDILNIVTASSAKGFWLHFDTDVLHDEENPAVDYRIPDGLRFDECEQLMSACIASGKVMGISIAIYNPRLDKDGVVRGRLVSLLETLLS